MKTSTFTFLALATLASLNLAAHGSVVVAPNVANTFSITNIANEDFTPWALANNATTSGSFGTYYTGYGWQSGAMTASSTASLTLTFNGANGYAFNSTVLNLSVAIHNYYGTSYGGIPAAWVHLNVDGVETKIFEWVSPNQIPMPGLEPTQFNFSGSAPAAGAFGNYQTTIDISTLVAGMTEFSITFTSKEGFSSELGNGGAFYQGDAAPFGLSGEMLAIPEPQTTAYLAMTGTAILWAYRRRRNLMGGSKNRAKTNLLA